MSGLDPEGSGVTKVLEAAATRSPEKGWPAEKLGYVCVQLTLE